MTAPALRFTLDGAELDARPGETILAAAQAAGRFIPHLCQHPALSPGGHCRLCTVLANGRPAGACHTPVSDGMVVESETPELQADRRRLLELLLVTGEHVCPACERSGACELQALAIRLGVVAPTLPALPRPVPADATHPALWLAHARCILCGRCVRAARELDRTGALGFEGRGLELRVAPGGGALAASGLRLGHRAAEVCPVGALLTRGDAWLTPIGRRRFDLERIDAEALEAGAPGPAGGTA